MPELFRERDINRLAVLADALVADPHIFLVLTGRILEDQPPATEPVQRATLALREAFQAMFPPGMPRETQADLARLQGIVQALRDRDDPYAGTAANVLSAQLRIVGARPSAAS